MSELWKQRILWISIFSVANQLVQIFTFPLWKKWAEQKSNTLMLVWVALGMALVPFLTVLSTNLLLFNTHKWTIWIFCFRRRAFIIQPIIGAITNRNENVLYHDL